MLVIPSRRQVHGSTYDTTLPPSELVNALYTHSSPTTDYTMVGSASTDYAAGTKDGEKQLEDEKHSDVEMQADDETIYKTMDAGDDAMEQKRAVAEEPADLEGSPPGSKEGSASPTTTTTPAYPVISTARAIILTILVMLASVLQVASGIGSSITIAEISRDLDIPTGDMQWISSAGSLATAASLLISGRCADILGHKAFLVLGSTVGAGMFLGMGLAQSKYELFVFRALAGVAFAGYVGSRTPSLVHTWRQAAVRSSCSSFHSPSHSFSHTPTRSSCPFLPSSRSHALTLPVGPRYTCLQQLSPPRAFPVPFGSRDLSRQQGADLPQRHGADPL